MSNFIIQFIKSFIPRSLHIYSLFRVYISSNYKAFSLKLSHSVTTSQKKNSQYQKIYILILKNKFNTMFSTVFRSAVRRSPMIKQYSTGVNSTTHKAIND